MYYLNKVKNHLYNWFEYAKEHLVRFITLFIVFFIFCYKFIHLNRENVMEDHIITEQHILVLGITIENWFTWISIISLALTALWALYQFDKSKIVKQQEKSAEIAKIFSESLLTKCSILINVIDNSPVKSIIDMFEDNNVSFHDFTTAELRTLTGEDDFPTHYKELVRSFDFDNLYYKILEKRVMTKQDSKNLENLRKNSFIKHSYSSSEVSDLLKFENSNLPFHFWSLVDDVLNSLEYICINLSTQAAGSSYIYQSLHQTFFDTVNRLGLEICIRNNRSYSDKFYTNIIKVYNDWQKIYQNSVKKENKHKKTNINVLNPKIKTVE